MTWTNPSSTDWSTGQVVTRAMMNTYLRDNLVHIGNSHAHGSSTGSGAGSRNLGSLLRIDFATGTAPSTAGRLKRVGAHLRYYGLQEIRITQADAASTEASPRTLGNGSLQAARGTHGHNSAGYAAAIVATTQAAGTKSAFSVGGGQFVPAANTTVTVRNRTSTQKIAALSVAFASVGVQHKVAIYADGVEQTSLTNASTDYAKTGVGLLALKLKNTANILFAVKLSNNKPAGTNAIQMLDMRLTGSTGTTGNLNPNMILAQANIGAA